MTKQFTTARDIADLLNLPLPRIYEVTRKGYFPPGVVIRIGRQIRYNRESLLMWLQNGGSVEQEDGRTQFK
jgi:predicted DNA-binding transcriptional regulator AlpA